MLKSEENKENKKKPVPDHLLQPRIAKVVFFKDMWNLCLPKENCISTSAFYVEEHFQYIRILINGRAANANEVIFSLNWHRKKYNKFFLSSRKMLCRRCKWKFACSILR